MIKVASGIQPRQTQQFHTLLEVFAYALRNGFTPTDLMQVRERIWSRRRHNPRDPTHWRELAVHKTKKSRHHGKNLESPVEVLLIQRYRGDWQVRITDSNEGSWDEAVRFSTMNANVKVHPPNKKYKKKKPAYKRKIEDFPDYLEIT